MKNSYIISYICYLFYFPIIRIYSIFSNNMLFATGHPKPSQVCFNYFFGWKLGTKLRSTYNIKVCKIIFKNMPSSFIRGFNEGLITAGMIKHSKKNKNNMIEFLKESIVISFIMMIVPVTIICVLGLILLIYKIIE